MAIPQVIFATCPGCGAALELNTIGWELTLAQKADDEEGPGGHGIFMQLAAFGGHVCWADA